MLLQHNQIVKMLNIHLCHSHVAEILTSERKVIYYERTAQ
jgi:hypothetical protein